MRISAKFILMTISVLSFTAYAQIDSIKQNYQSQLVNDTYGATSSNPGYQVATKPNKNWAPKINLNNATGTPDISLNNAYGTPRIDISRATGQIANTSGINNDIRDYVKNNAGGHAEWTPLTAIDGTYSVSGTVPIGTKCTTPGRVVYTKNVRTPTNCRWVHHGDGDRTYRCFGYNDTTNRAKCM